MPNRKKDSEPLLEPRDIILFHDDSKDSRKAVQAAMRQTVLNIEIIGTDDGSRLPRLLNGLFDPYFGSDQIIKFLNETIAERTRVVEEKFRKSVRKK